MFQSLTNRNKVQWTISFPSVLLIMENTVRCARSKVCVCFDFRNCGRDYSILKIYTNMLILWTNRQRTVLQYTHSCPMSDVLIFLLLKSLCIILLLLQSTTKTVSSCSLSESLMFFLISNVHFIAEIFQKSDCYLGKLI